VFRDLGQRLTLSFGRRLTRVAVISVVTICAAVSLAPSAASSATKPKPNKDVICSSIVTAKAVADATQVAVAPATNLNNGGFGPVHFPFLVPFYQLGNSDTSLPGSSCQYNYANDAQGVSGPIVAEVVTGFGPVKVSAWHSYEAFERKHAFTGAVGVTGPLGQIATLGFQALNLGDGSRAFEMSLSNYYENTSTQTPVIEDEVFALTRHGNIIMVELTPVLVSSSGAWTDSTEGMIRALVTGALSEGPF
jgi:hypothetical protein